MPKDFRIIRGVLAVICLAMAGCEAGHKGSVRSKAPDDPTSWNGSPISGRSENTGGDDASAGKGFLKSSRLPGAMSSEGEEIERSLGVGR